LGEAAAAEVAGDLRGDADEGAAGERGQQAEGEQRGAERVEDDPRSEGDEGRVIDVAEGEVAGAGDVVELVAEDAVAVGGEQMQEDGGCGEDPDEGVLFFRGCMLRGIYFVGLHTDRLRWRGRGGSASCLGDG